MKITNIRIEYEDGSDITFGAFELEKLARLEGVIDFIERAKRVYENLKPLFKKET